MKHFQGRRHGQGGGEEVEVEADRKRKEKESEEQGGNQISSKTGKQGQAAERGESNSC